MSDQDIYHGEFGKRDLLDRIQAVRTAYCTGPCGQSSSVLTMRSNTEATLREASKEIERLRVNLGYAVGEVISLQSQLDDALGIEPRSNGLAMVLEDDPTCDLLANKG